MFYKHLFLAVAINAGATLTAQAAVLDDCLYEYWYANIGDSFGNQDRAVTVSCLDPAGCSSILYAPSECDGCLDPSCTSLLEAPTALAQGELTSWTNADVLAAGATAGISNGDTICSDGQLSVISSSTVDNGATINRGHVWAPGSNAGTRFSYRSYRGNAATCVVFSFVGARVNISVNYGAPVVDNVAIPAFGVITQSSLNSRDNNVQIYSDQPVVVSCYEAGNDFSHVYPVSSGDIYGWNSQFTHGTQVDCDSLEVKMTSLPVCFNSSDDSVPPKDVTDYFEITASVDQTYLGNPIRCSPGEPGACLSVLTTADQFGSESTSWISAKKFATYFVVGVDSLQLAFLSTEPSTKCTVRASVGGAVDRVVDVDVDPGTYVNSGYDASAYPSGSTINCTAPVGIVGQWFQDEHNLLGLEDEASWAGFSSSFLTCSPTSSPSASPTLSPSTSPSTSPSISPSMSPTESPSTSPSTSPTTSSPSTSPTTTAPSASPTTTAPSTSPITSAPSTSPTTSTPTIPTVSPTASPVVPTEASPAAGNIGPIVGGVVGSLFAILAVAFVLVLYRRKRRREQEEASDAVFAERPVGSKFEVDISEHMNKML